MSKELDLILEYERARREIKRLGIEIQESTHHPFNPQDFYRPKCTEFKVNNDTQCFELLWDWNRKSRNIEKYQDDDLPEPDGEEPPNLCEFCKITQSLVNQRKAAKKRFGIAKMRISRFASGYISSVGVD